MQQTAALEQELKTTRQNQEAAQLVGSVLTNVIGDYAKSQTKIYDEASLKKDLLQGQLAKATDPAMRSELEKGITEVDATLALNQDKYDMWKDGGVGKIGLHGLAGYLEGRISGGPAGAAAFAAVSNEALSAAVNNAIAEAIASDKTGGSKNDAATAKAYGEAAATLIGSLAGALTGGTQGAAIGGQVALTADQNNRQLHQKDKTLAKKLAANSNGKYTQQQIEDAMRAGGNSELGEDITAGMVVPLTGNTPASAVYDSAGMKLVHDGAGNSYLVQQVQNSIDPALAAYIQTNTGGNNSPYNWSPVTLGVIPPSDPITSGSPFAPGWNTGNYSAGIPGSELVNRPIVVIQAGFHLPITPGIAAGPNFSLNSNGNFTTKPDIAIGTIIDGGANIGIYGDDRYSSPATLNLGLGKYLGLQITPSNVTAWEEKYFTNPARYINGVSVGVGAGVASPVNVSVDPTYASPTPRK